MAFDPITLGLYLAAYLLASVSVGVLVARAKGVDIYAIGSGNPGSSNVFRSLGRSAALTVYLADMLKGFIPAIVGVIYLDLNVATFAGLCAVAGHCYPVFHRFRGGKGVATAGGVVMAVVPIVVAINVIVYVALVKLTKMSSVGSIGTVLVTLPAAAVVGLRGWALIWLGAFNLLIIYRHRSNITRLRGGSEHKVVNQ
jgi:glycerol-3-phosphate acyltransferase PlsY